MQKLIIPINEVLISETYYPPGWLVGAYDEEGFIYRQKWFSKDELVKAQDYASTIVVPVN